MKKILCLLPFAFCLLFISGCQESAKKTVKTTVKADSNFPQIMVGVWEARTGENPGERWVIELDSNGLIKNMDHFVGGPIVVAEGGRSDLGPDPNTSFSVILGPCTSSFDPKTEILNLEINLDYFEMLLPQGALSGRMKDTFSGKVSRDGHTWEADWRSYGWLESASPPDVNDINANPEKLIFKKIDLKSLADSNSADPNKSSEQK